MRKAFSMIELIFVIVILGILAAMAIPRLMATRSDAELVKLKSNLTTFITDLNTYIISQGEIGPDVTMRQITNVSAWGKGAYDRKVLGPSGKGSEFILEIMGDKCILLTIYESKNDNGIKRPAYLKIQYTNQRSGMCSRIRGDKGITEFLDKDFTYQQRKSGVWSTVSAKATFGSTSNGGNIGYISLEGSPANFYD